MVAILVARFEPTVAGSYGGFIALIVCLCSILVAILGVGVYYFFVRTPADPHAHHTVSVSTSSLPNTPSPPPPHPQSPPQSQGRWLGLLPLSFRSKPSRDAERALGVQSTRPPIWRKGSEGKPVWMQASSGDEWDTEDGYSQKSMSTQAASGERAMRMAQRDSLAKSDFESISEEAADALQALPAVAKITRGPGSGSSSSTTNTYYSRNRSKSPPGSGSLQRQMQMNSIESVRSLNTSPEPYASTDDQHSQAALVREEASELEGNGHVPRDSEGSVSTRTSHTGTKFVEALDDI